MKHSRWIRGLSCMLMVVALLAVLSWVVMLLWNLLMPSLFALPALSFMQAAGLLVLVRILFGGFRGRGFAWRRDMIERWDSMSDAERERLRSGLRRRCGPWR